MLREEESCVLIRNLRNKEDKSVKLQQIKAIAKKKGVKAEAMIKVELIRAIQRAEGNRDCFFTEHIAVCGQMSCLWREDCLKGV